jgi:putative two-component system response regulator
MVRPTVLIVDDEAAARDVAARILASRFDVELASNASEARTKLLGVADLLLCDMNMPGESGFDLVKDVLARDQEKLAVVMVTADDSPEMADRAFEVGAYGYLVKPYRRGDLLITVNSAMRRREIEQQAQAHERELELEVAMKSLEAEHVYQLLRRSEESLEQSRLETVRKLSLAVEKRDQVTGHHLSRMGSYCEELGRRVGLPGDVCDSIALAGQMHDIGKVAVPDQILLKMGPLTQGERAQMQTHAQIGKEILQGSESPLLQLAETIAWTHHEKVDGTGYPRGLRGDQIPIEGRVAAVADVFDALTRDRPYRDAMSLEQATAVMSEGRGTHFDAHVLDAFLADLTVEVGAV